LIALSTPLFFRSAEGLVQNTRLNFAEDLPYQKDLLPKEFAWPLWDSWVNIHNIQAALHASDVFRTLETEPLIESARHVSLESLKGRAVLFLGHPRGAAVLVDLLSPLNFYVDRSSSGQSLDASESRRHNEPALSAVWRRPSWPILAARTSLIARFATTDPISSACLATTDTPYF
jgi:hypothetical protein